MSSTSNDTSLGANPNRRSLHGQLSDYKFKFIVVGSPGVGKTSLMQQFVENTFSTEIEPTIGIGFAAKNIHLKNSKFVKLQLWDTAGQESFRAITYSYYRNTHGALLVFDITKKESLEQVKYWLVELQQHAPENIAIALVANKADMCEDVSLVEEGKKFAEENDLLFQLASAKTGLGVEEIFQQTAEEVEYKVNNGLLTLENQALIIRPSKKEGPPQKGGGALFNKSDSKVNLNENSQSSTTPQSSCGC